MSEWTTNDWILVVGVPATVIVLRILAIVVRAEFAAKRRRRERRAEWEAARPLREAMARQSEERRKAEEKRVLALIEDLRIKPEEQK